MTPYERIKAMVNHKAVDRPGASAWKHFHEDDRNVGDLVRRTIAFQNMNQWDFVKIMANGVYVQEQYGADIRWSRDGIEFPATIHRVVNSPRGLRHLEKVDVKTGPIHREVEVAKRLAWQFGGKVPIIATVFTPLTYVQELYNGFQNPDPFKDLVRYYGDDLKEGLKVLTDLTARIIEEFTAAGVDGIFYSSQFGNDLQMTPELYEEFGKPYDLQAFAPAVGKTWFNVMHIHGDTNLFFDKFLDYPLEAFNWQSPITNVSLSEAAQKTDKILIGGLEREHDFRGSDRAQLKEHIRQRVEAAISSVPANRLILAPGCSLPNDLPEWRFHLLREVLAEKYGEQGTIFH